MHHPKGFPRFAMFLGICVSAATLSATAQVVSRLAADTGQVYSAVPVNGEIWLASQNGAFRIDSKTKTPVQEGDTGYVYSIVPLNGEIWIAARNGAFRVDSHTKQPKPVEGKTGGVGSIVPVSGEVWLVAAKGAFRVDW